MDPVGLHSGPILSGAGGTWKFTDTKADSAGSGEDKDLSCFSPEEI